MMTIISNNFGQDLITIVNGCPTNCPKSISQAINDMSVFHDSLIFLGELNENNKFIIKRAWVRNDNGAYSKMPPKELNEIYYEAHGPRSIILKN